MLSLDDAYVDSLAPNADAIKNGRALVLKKKFLALHIDEDGTLLFGSCQGSGASPYRCSCDFRNPAAPTHRCTCPSRQFPCKHCLGLLYAFAQGRAFTREAVPVDLVELRAKAQAKVEKRKEDRAKPRKVNTSALAKKIEAQLAGLDLLESLTLDLARLGMGNMNAKTAAQVEEQAKQLGNAFLPGAQAALHAYTSLFAGDDGRFDRAADARARESVYGEALDHLTRLHALVRQGRSYLRERLADPALAPATDTSIAAWLGHAWQLAELRAVGLAETEVELVQLAFDTLDDLARREYVDTGVWMNLSSGHIQLTQTFRPHHAAKLIKGDDSFFQVAMVRELCVYPGDANPRVRWEEMRPRPLAPADLARVAGHAHDDFAAITKAVKNQLKSPLADRRPVYALRFARIGMVGEAHVVEDRHGNRVVLTDAGPRGEPPTCRLLGLMPPSALSGHTVVVRFHHDVDARTLRAKPLCIVTDTAISRLLF